MFIIFMFSMHDYSRDIMLANAQQDMEAGLAKMQLNKKIAATKARQILKSF